MTTRNANLPLDIIGMIYEAALEPHRWAEVLERVEQGLQAQSSALYLQDLRALEASFEVLRGLDPARMRTYYTHYINIDPNYAYRMSQPVGTATASHLVMPDKEFEETEYYQDFMRHLNRFYTTGGLVARDDQRVAVFSLQRDRARGPFSKDELGVVGGLLPHLQRAFQIARQLAGREIERQTLLALLERLPTGVLLLDERARVVFLNRRAQAIVAAGDALTITPQGLAAVVADAQPALERLIGEAVRAGAGQARHSGGALVLPSTSGREPYHVLVAPLRTERLRLDVGPDRVCAALFVQLRESRPAIAPDLLRELFGLTGAEARVASALVQGRKPEEIAAALDTSRFTVRAQLSSIYEKLGVHRQAEVVQRVLSSPAVMGEDDGGGR